MKVLPLFFEKTKINHSKPRTTLSNSATLSSDVFEKQNYTPALVQKKAGLNIPQLIHQFGFKESEATQIQASGLTTNDIPRLKDILSKGLNLDEATECVYLNDFQIEQFINFPPAYNLSAKDKIGLIAFEIEGHGNLKRYEELSKSLQQYEALLATKLGLNNSQIETYKKQRSSNITYSDYDGATKSYHPTDDEWMICIKENFDNEQQKRFAQLRNRKKDFRSNTVRKQGSEQAYPFNYIISCIKERKTDEDIEKENTIFDITSQGFSLNMAFDIITMQKEEKEKYEKFKQDGENTESAILLEKLTPNEFHKYQDMIASGIDKELAIRNATLTPEQIQEIEDIVTSKNIVERERTFQKLISKPNKNSSEWKQEEIDFFLNYLSDEQVIRYKQLINQGTETGEALELANLTQEEFERYNSLCNSANGEWEIRRIEKYDPNKEIELGVNVIQKPKKKIQSITFRQLMFIVKNTALKSLKPELLERLPDDFWYKITMGCEKEAHDIIQKAISELLLIQGNKESSFKLSPVRTLKMQLQKAGQGYNSICYSKCKDYTLDRNGNFELKQAQTSPFKINLQQGLIYDKSVLVINDLASSNRYVSYNGAIAKVTAPTEHDCKQFEKWGNLSPEIQGKILAQAANEFVFNLFDEEGNCILGTEEYNIKDKTDKQISQYYSDKFLELKTENKLTVSNILKLVPQDCMLSINPYVTDGQILFSIVAEWYSKENSKWQLEVHSQDTNWVDTQDSTKWILRLHKNKNNKYECFQFQPDGSCNFGGDFSGENSKDSHIKIPSPINDALLNNVEFQNIIKQISSQLHKSQEISTIAKTLGIPTANDPNNTIQNIVNHCLKNPVDFARYKDLIIKLRANLGMANII